jgi:hypothetical protein
MGRDRAGYPQAYTRNDLRAQGRYAGALYDRVFAYTLDGQPFGDEPLRYRAPGRYERRFPTKDSEFEIVARALAEQGATGLAFETGEKPDWKIRFPNGAIIGAEASEIDETADFTNQLMDLQIALAEAVDADSALPIGRHTVHFIFGARAFPMGFTKDALPGRVRRVVVGALLEYLRAGTFVSGPIVGYPALEAFGIIANVNGGGPAIAISEPACCFSPTGPLNAAIYRVRLKIERAAKYDQRYPLWLFLHITDMMGEFSQTIERFAKVGGPIAPFEAVFLSDGRKTAVIRKPKAA